MKSLIVTLLIVITTQMAWSQDPSCEYVITIEQTTDSLYAYSLYIEDTPLESTDVIVAFLEKEETLQTYGQMEVFASVEGGEKLVIYYGTYCYPLGTADQLRLFISRQHKVTGDIEVMYTTAPVVSGLTDIHFPDFREGERSNTIYIRKDPMVKASWSKYNNMVRIFQKRIIEVHE